jgi:hypothetical protein
MAVVGPTNSHRLVLQQALHTCVVGGGTGQQQRQ